MKGEIAIHAAEASNEMIFEGADCTFGCIAAVYIWRYKLVVNTFIDHELLKGIRAFIVKSL